ncbi:S-adenosyl-L-methionine-dependent methyltransferases superfamily protein [Tanacetum coccineum]
MEDNMLKAQSNVIDIMCNLELIYPPGFLEIMIHLVIHLPLEALEGRPIRPRWMYPFKRFIKKLKNYVRNKAKPEGSIADGYVAEEALTFSSHYFWDVTMKFNHSDRNVDFPPPTPEIDTYRVKFKSRDERRTTQNSGICSPGEDGEMYYGQLEQILEFLYMSFKTVLFRVKWFDTSNKGRVKHLVIRNNITLILANGRPDIITCCQSSDLALTTTLNDLEIATLHINGQSIDVDALQDIIDVDEDDDIINDEDVLPHDLADYNDEYLINVDDDDGVAVMLADVARGHKGDGGGDDRPNTMSLLEKKWSKGIQKPNLGGRKSGRMHTRKETRNLGLRKITDELGPQPIRFEWKDNGMMLPLGDHSAHWANLLGEIVREFPMHFGSWRSIPPERKASVLGKIGAQFDFAPTCIPELWPDFRKGIDQTSGKITTQ